MRLLKIHHSFSENAFLLLYLQQLPSSEYAPIVSVCPEGLECWVIPGKTWHQVPLRVEALWHKHLTGPGVAVSRSREPASVSSKHGVTGPRTSSKPGFSRPHAGPCHPFLDLKGGKQGRTTAFVWGDDSIFFFFSSSCELREWL